MTHAQQVEGPVPPDGSGEAQSQVREKAGIPQSVGEEYAAADAGTSYNALPERVKNAPKGGKMSSAAVKTKLGVVRKPAPKPVKKPKGK